MKFRFLSLVFLIVLLVLAIFNFEMIHANPTPSVVGQVTMDWVAFWQKVNQHSAWDLEWYNGASWISVKSDLTIMKDYSKEDTCKITLIFDASKNGNYRLTFGVDARVLNYIVKLDKYQYELEYEEFSVIFDWSDVISIPNLVITHGISEVAGDKYFWFRIRRDSVPLGAHVEIDPSVVGTSTALTAVNFAFQLKGGFYCAGRYWAFYVNGVNFVYCSSTDAITWNSPTTIAAATAGDSCSIFFDGTYVHYARYAAYDTYYRRGTPNSDGTITWSAAEQKAYDGTSTIYYNQPVVAVDSDGYPWIGVRCYDGIESLYLPSVMKSSTNDGTFVMASGFPYDLNATTDSLWRVQPVPLTLTKMYMVYCLGNALPRGRLYNGGWGSEESDLADYNIGVSSRFMSIAEGDHVHFSYLRQTIYQIRHNKRTYGTGWGANDVLVQGAVTEYTQPALSINTGNNDVYCFWITTTDHVYYKKYVSGSWDANPTDWQDESADTFYSEYMIACSPKAYTNIMSVMYVTKSASPFNVKFAYLTIAAGQEYSRSASQSLTLSLIASKLFEIIRPATQAIELTSSGTKFIDITRMVAQGITINLVTSRIADFFRIASQTLTFTFQTIAEKVGEYPRNVALTLTITIESLRQIDITRTASQALSFLFFTSRIPYFSRTASQTLTITSQTTRLIEVTRQVSQTLQFLFNGERLIDITRIVSQAINFALTGSGSLVTEFERAASLTLTFMYGVMGIFGNYASIGYVWAVIIYGLFIILPILAFIALRRKH